MDKKIYFILLVLTALFSYGQVELVAEVEDKEVKVNETFKVNFVLQVIGNEYTQESKLKLPDLSKFNIIGTASSQNTYVNPRTNDLVNQIVYQCVLEAKKSGKTRIGSALVQINGKILKTEPIDIYIGEGPAKSQSLTKDLASSNSIYLNLEVKDKEIYPNQPTLAVLRAFSKNFNNYRQIGSLQFPKQHNAQFAMVNSSRQDIETEKHNDYSSQVIGVFLIYPTESGNIEIEPISTALHHKEAKLLSNKINLKVASLPSNAPSGFTNAVGKYSLSVTADTLQAKINEPIHVAVKIKGEGNLNNIVLPKIIEKENYKVYPPKFVKNITVNNQGISGEVTAEYIVMPTQPGALAIETEQFAYFDPSTKHYVATGAQVLSGIAVTEEQLANAKTTLEKVNDISNNIIETVNTPIIPTLKVTDSKVKKGKLNWTIIAINTLIILGIVLLINYLKIRRKNKNNTTSKNTKKPIETISETEAKLKKEQKFSVEDHLHYLMVLKNNNDYKSFFENFDNLKRDIDLQLINTKYNNLSSYIKSHFNQEIQQKFSAIDDKILELKYAPSPSSEEIDGLYNDICNLYSKITE